MKKRLAVGGVIAVLVVTLFTLAALATTAEMYFSSDKNGANRVTNVQEGDQIWIAVYDPDQNIDCDLRDKMWVDLKVFDPKTGAYIVWESYNKAGTATGYIGIDGSTSKGNFLEETGADTGLFVSNKAFQVGTREDYTTDWKNTHVVGLLDITKKAGISDFQWGHYLYDGGLNLAGTNVKGDTRGWFGSTALTSGTLTWGTGLMPSTVITPVMPSAIRDFSAAAYDTNTWYLVGRFENMDTLVGMYADPNDATDVAVTMGKIIDTKSTISWDQEVYKDSRGAATITVVDPDENLNCNKVEYVPVWILVNPGSWNVQTNSRVNNFCMLKRTGGVIPQDSAPAGVTDGALLNAPVRWYNIYNGSAESVTSSPAFKLPGNSQPTSVGAYYVQYPVAAAGNVTSFDTADADGYCRVMFYAQETGVSTGVFQLNLNSIRADLGFNNLNVHDVLVAYYLDPNDFDDFSLAPAYIEEHQHSVTSFTNATRGEKSEYWLGRDPVYVQVIDSNANVDSCCPEQVVVHICDPHGEDDSEYLIADETSSNSPVFFTNAGTQLLPVWDALGVGLVGMKGGYQLALDNWKLEAFNEDVLYARYNDVYYELGTTGLAGLGDQDAFKTTPQPPAINRIRVANDVSFDTMSIGDSQVYNGSTVNMYFLDRQGNRVSGYVNSDCVFVEVVDPDQDEDQYRRERIDGFWDGHQNIPFGPQALNYFECKFTPTQTNSVNALLGKTNIFGATDDTPAAMNEADGWAKLYVLNPRNGRWAAVDLLETGVATGDFVSVTCIDLVDVYTCVPTLAVLPGDTIVAFYQDPSNHSDSAMISIKVGLGGGGTPPGQASTTMFVDADGNEVTSYTDADDVYVKVIDPSKAGAASILDAVTISGTTYDLAHLAGAATDTFITEAISGLGVGTFTATYADPTDPTDTSSDTIDIIASELSVDNFYAGPNPFTTTVTFGYNGSGIAATFSVTVYNLSGHAVWTEELANVDHVTWDGSSTAGSGLANGGYIYVVMATDGENTFTGKGTVFINK
ncbi:hypothetical protein D4R47_04395 [archaeon]|nr:MAG: hypothetical protein D4R47_04395 [archaeon]